MVQSITSPMTADELTDAQAALSAFVAAQTAYRAAKVAYDEATDTDADAAFETYAESSDAQAQAMETLHPYAARLHSAETIYHRALTRAEATLYGDMLTAIREYYGGSTPWAD